jgi:hypothetical protein
MTETNPVFEPHTPPLARLRDRGFDVLCVSHAEAILSNDFLDGLTDIENVLAGFRIGIEEIVHGGGGETPFTQRLRRSFAQKQWVKREFVIRKLIDDVETQATSHEVDHVKSFERGTIALEIEWNNKDPFYDRDLDNFKRLHADGGISAGAIITRGTSLHDNLKQMLMRFAADNHIDSLDAIEKHGYHPTARQARQIQSKMAAGATFADAWVAVFKSDKFGEATTHWRKLKDRVLRGAGNPCPLLLIGLPQSIVDH